MSRSLLSSILLPDGRTLPINLSAFIMFQSMFDAAGLWQLTLPIPNDSNLVGVTVYSCYVSYQSRIFGISKNFSFMIQS